VSKTLLDGVNETLKRVNIVNATLLTSLTDSGKQHDINVCVQVINEGIDEIYSFASAAQIGEGAESTITLVAGTADYALASDLVQIRWPMIDKTDTQYIFEFPGGYDAMLVFDPEQDDTGLPIQAAINPNNNRLHVWPIPTSADAGRVYTYQYDKNLALSAATDAMPFTDAAFRAMVPVWAQLWKRERRNEFDQTLYYENLGRAARFLTQAEPRTSYSPR